MRFSYSRIGCFANCPYQYKLRYIDELKTIPDQAADNALYLGTAIHTAFETGSVEEAIKSYRSNYYILTDAHINEEIKLEILIPKVLARLPKAECEVEISTDEFVGFIDRLVYLFTDEQGIAHYEIWDYKYCNSKSIERYLQSGQLHIYKYYFEKTHPNTVVDALKYVFIPKVNIRQKKTETIHQFRQRLREVLETTEPIVRSINYNKDMITDFSECCKYLLSCNEFPKNETNLCGWCAYEPLCKRNEDWILL